MVPSEERKVPVMGLDFVKTKWGWQVCPPGDQFVTGSLERWGVYSELEVELLKSVHHAGGGSSMVAGGNIGAVAVPLALSGGRVWTYEPQPLLAKLIEANKALAGASSLTVENVALGPCNGQIEVPVIDFGCDYNMGRFGKEDWDKPHPKGGAAKVQMIDFAKEVGQVKPGLILLDVEGMELELLSELDGKLGELKPYLWIEDDRVEQHEGLMGWMERNGYVPYWVISPLAPLGVRPDEGPWPMQCSFNLLCVPEGRSCPVEGLREAEVGDNIGSCPADWIVWNLERG